MRETTTPEPDEAAVAADLVRRIAAGDAAAEDALVRRYRRGLLVLLRRRGAQPDLAEDLAQDALWLVLDRLRLRGLAHPEKLAGFLHGTACLLLKNERRKQERRKTLADAEAIDRTEHPAPAATETLIFAEEAAAVRRFLAALPNERDREILHRFHVLEQGKATICAALQLDSLHFNRVLYRARRRFLEVWKASRDRRGKA